MMNPDVVVPTRDSWETLPRCIASIRREFPGSRIILVDDSRDLKTALVASQLGALVTRGPSRGVGAARNYALGLVSTPVFVFVDSDAELSHGFRGILGEVKGNAALVNGFVLFGEPGFSLLARCCRLQRRLGRGNVSLAGAAVSLEAARKVGFFELNAGEDGDFVKRLREEGYMAYTDHRFTVNHPMTPRELYSAQEWYGESARGRGLTWALKRFSTINLTGIYLFYKSGLREPGFMVLYAFMAFHWARGFIRGKA